MFKKNRLHFLFFIIVALLGILLLKSSKELTMEDEFSHLVRINPVPQVQKFIQQKQFAEANEYLSYFMDYDYVSQNPEAIQLYNDIQAVRNNWFYKLKKANSGFWLGESDETEGQIAAIASDLLFIGDVRDLGGEGKNFITGRDVNEVSAALSAIGIAATGFTIASAVATPVTGGASAPVAAAAISAKPTVIFLKIANKAGKIPKWLGKSLVESVKIAKETKSFYQVVGLFSDIQDLYKTAGAHSTLELLGKSNSLEDFRRLAKFGHVFEKKTATLLKVAGDDAIVAYQRISDVRPNIFLEASTFGKEGINSLERNGVAKFQKFLEAEKYTRRRVTSLEKQIIDSGKKVRFSDQYFIQRDDLFDPKYLDAIGRSNIDRMKQGLAPIGKDGNPINLHHMKQQNNGIISEISYTEHKENSNILHRYVGKDESEIDRTTFNKLRTTYWKERAKGF